MVLLYLVTALFRTWSTVWDDGATSESIACGTLRCTRGTMSINDKLFLNLQLQ